MKRIGTHLGRNVVAYMALFFALGGTSVAAVQALPRNSVGSPQIRNGSIQRIDISRRTVRQLRGQRGPRGLRGPQGLQGAQGPQGPTGTPDTSNFYTKAQSDSRFVRAEDVFSIAGSAFHPRLSTTGYSNGPGCGPNQLFWTGGGDGIFIAPVHLPSGVTVTRFTLHFTDFSAGTNYSADLVRQQTSETGPWPFEVMATVNTAGPTGSQNRSASNTTITAAGIDNDGFHYFVLVRLAEVASGNACLNGAEVAYTR